MLYTPRCFHRTLKRYLSNLYGSPQVSLRVPTVHQLNAASRCHPWLDLQILDHHQVITVTLIRIIRHCRCRRHPRPYTSSRDNRRPMAITSHPHHLGRTSGTVSAPPLQPLTVQRRQSSHIPHHTPCLRTAGRSVNSSTTHQRRRTRLTDTLRPLQVRALARARDRPSKRDGIRRRQCCHLHRCLRVRCSKRSRPHSR